MVQVQLAVCISMLVSHKHYNLDRMFLNRMHNSEMKKRYHLFNTKNLLHTSLNIYTIKDNVIKMLITFCG